VPGFNASISTQVGARVRFLFLAKNVWLSEKKGGAQPKKKVDAV